MKLLKIKEFYRPRKQLISILNGMVQFMHQNTTLNLLTKFIFGLKMSSTSRVKSIKSLVSDNPEASVNDILSYKRKKNQQFKNLKIKMTVEKQVKKMMKKDQDLYKQYLKKKRQLNGERKKQEEFIQNRKYKEWLDEEKQKKSLFRNFQTQQLKQKIDSDLKQSKERYLSTKKSNANSTKNLIKDWKMQKALRDQKQLELNRKKFIQTESRKLKTRQSNRNYFEQKHSRIVEQCKNDVSLSEKSNQENMQKIIMMEKSLVDLKNRSQKRAQLIKQIEDDILSVKNQTLSISRSRQFHRVTTPISSKHSLTYKDKMEIKPQKKERKTLKISGPYERSFSLPTIRHKIYYNKQS